MTINSLQFFGTMNIVVNVTGAADYIQSKCLPASSFLNLVFHNTILSILFSPYTSFLMSEVPRTLAFSVNGLIVNQCMQKQHLGSLFLLCLAIGWQLPSPAYYPPEKNIEIGQEKRKQEPRLQVIIPPQGKFKKRKKEKKTAIRTKENASRMCH